MNYDWLTATSTGVIAAFTVVLAFVTGAQSILTYRLLKLTRLQFFATHRPRIIVRFIQGPMLDHKDNHQSIWITVANVGETLAIIEAAGFDLARRKAGGDWLPPGLAASAKPIDPIVLEPGERHTFTARGQAPYSQTDKVTDVVGDTELCAVGQLRYRDESGIVRETGLFRVYEWSEKCFVRSGDSEQDYED